MVSPYFVVEFAKERQLLDFYSNDLYEYASDHDGDGRIDLYGTYSLRCHADLSKKKGALTSIADFIAGRGWGMITPGVFTDKMNQARKILAKFQDGLAGNGQLEKVGTPPPEGGRHTPQYILHTPNGDLLLKLDPIKGLGRCLNVNEFDNSKSIVNLVIIEEMPSTAAVGLEVFIIDPAILSPIQAILDARYRELADQNGIVCDK